MNIAVTIWGNRVSPVFDSAKNLMIVQVGDRQISERDYDQVDFSTMDQCLSVLKKHQVDVLICGAITDVQSETVRAASVRLFPFISGQAEAVLESFMQDQAQITQYLMPGARLEH